ncbi:MAG: histidine phosphatase family protein [Burkholderiaceae bacterium]|nr:histidine phosphatase family protein [Burkholderiaceae bacterium]
MPPSSHALHRRTWLAWTAVAASPWPALAADAAAQLRQGGCVLLLRHAQTTPGIGDPPEFQLGRCETQRNLSDAGRAQADRIGAWLQARQLAPSAVRSSAWCRCIDTADRAFGSHTRWPALNSHFGDRLDTPDTTAELRTALQKRPSGPFEAWVTHQVNITALTGEVPAMGEGFVVDRQGRVLARTLFA